MRGQGSTTTITPDGMVAASAQGEVMELTRGQETELPQALKWQLARAGADYDAVLVEAQRITVSAARIASESFAVAVRPEEAERRCRQALMETWVWRESAVFKLPASRLALDPCDVILLDHDGRMTEFRLISVADNEIRSIEARRQGPPCTRIGRKSLYRRIAVQDWIRAQEQVHPVRKSRGRS